LFAVQGHKATQGKTMLEELTYRFTSFTKQREQRARMQGYGAENDADMRKRIAESNDKQVDRLKRDLELHEESTVADLRAAAQALANK
jgi:hypothetical protein